METIKFIGLICFTWLFTTGAAPIQFVKELFNVHIDSTAKDNTSKILTKLLNCDLCVGFWFGLIIYQDIWIASILSLSCEIFSRILSKFGF